MNKSYDIVSINLTVKPRSQRRGLLSRLAMQVWLFVNVQSMLLKSEMLAGNNDEVVIRLTVQPTIKNVTQPTTPAPVMTPSMSKEKLAGLLANATKIPGKIYIPDISGNLTFTDAGLDMLKAKYGTMEPSQSEKLPDQEGTA